MKLFEQLKKILESENLNEGASDILYHFTSAHAVENMLKNDFFSLTLAVGGLADFKVNNGRHFFFSTTRSRSTGYKTGNVRLTLDGRALKQNYKFVPVDYWGYSKNPDDYNSMSDYKQALSNNEQEDRIVSDKSKIPNASKYISEIHYFYRKGYNFRKDLVQLSREKNIPIFVYDDEKNWHNAVKPLPPKAVEGLLNMEQENDDYDSDRYERYPFDLAALIAYNNEEGKKAIEQSMGDPELVEKFNFQLDGIIRVYLRKDAWHASDAVPKFKNVIHNSRSNPNKTYRFLFDLLSKDMRKHKAKDISDYITKKQMVGKKSLDDYKKRFVSQMWGELETEFGNEFDYRFGNDWIEINGEYYNKANESPELAEYFLNILAKARKVLVDLLSNNEIFRYNYNLDHSYIFDKINLDDIIPEKDLNITDAPGRYADGELDKTGRDLVYRVIVNVFNSEAAERLEEIYNEYLEQFNN